MALKFITADEAAALVQHGDNIGFSGFTPAGCPKVVPGAIAKRAEEEHAAGRRTRSRWSREAPHALSVQ